MNDRSSSIDSMSSYQLPVITSAESVDVMPTAGHTTDDDNAKAMISIKRSTTIASGDFDIDNDNDDEIDNSNNDNNNDDNNNKSDSSTILKSVCNNNNNIFELLLSLCLSFVFKSLFGNLIYIIRTLFFGYILNYYMKFISSVTEKNIKQQYWISQLLQFNTAAAAATATSIAISIDKGSVVVGSSQTSSSSWPPPTFLALAIVSIMTLIVHPDGYTWIILYKLRDGIDFVLKLLSSCWSIVVHEYGSIVSTMFAIGTFATLFFFVYVLHRTLKSRTAEYRQQRQQQQQQSNHNNHNHKSNDKHRRKKRKQNTRHQKHNNTGRLKNTTDTSDSKGTDSIDVAMIQNQTNPTDSDLIQKDDSIPTTLHTNTMLHDETIHYPLPPLAEDKPLDSPPSTSNFIGTTNNSLFSLQHYDSQQQSSSSSPRSRTASTSTTDSVLLSIDDQSSCSGRSTPTPISANESSVHPSFVTTIINNSKQQQSSSSNPDPIDNRIKNIVSNNSTPNRNNTHNGRRSQNNRRSGKKNNHVADSVTIGSERPNDPPPVHVPSKRWDALKPTNRIMNNRQQRYGSTNNTNTYRPGNTQINKSGQINSTGTVPSISTDERQPASHCQSKDRFYTPERTKEVSEPRDVLSNDSPNLLTSFLNPHVVLSDYEQQQSGNSIKNNTSTMLYTNPTPNHTYQPFLKNDEIPQSITGLNPNSPSWSGFRSINTNFPDHQQQGHYYTQQSESAATHQGDSIYNLDHFNNTGTCSNITPEYIQSLSTPVRSTKLGMNEQNQFYTNANHSISEPFSYKRSELSDISYTPCSDFTFFGTGNGYNGNHIDFGNNGTERSTVSIPPVDTTMISTSPMSIGTFYHRCPHHTHVRENPFESSDDDDEDDDDQIEAKLLELGGQMVGNILDF